MMKAQANGALMPTKGVAAMIVMRSRPQGVVTRDMVIPPDSVELQGRAAMSEDAAHPGVDVGSGNARVEIVDAMLSGLWLNAGGQSAAGAAARPLPIPRRGRSSRVWASVRMLIPLQAGPRKADAGRG
ncbi:hypothetical protein [Paracoccus sp. (in: a-proteobacteria)]|uniref:hypothetical protein n=1 Tax=Paracoccus sp. TaxID=267 RepID=UPI00321F6507